MPADWRGAGAGCSNSGSAGVISAINGWISSDELQALQARMPVLADNEVIVHRNAKRCHFDVGARRRRESRSASKQFEELLHSEAGIGDDATQST
jgi:hypothetical protein